jgi:hypothetical protein
MWYRRALHGAIALPVGGIEPRPWREALAEVIRELYQSASPPG